MSRLRFTLTQLEYALAVHRYGHFARAAEACHVTQPTLSMQLLKLEETLGVALFDRSKKPILLTNDGEKLIPRIQAILDEAKNLEAALEGSKVGSVRGRLMVGIIPTVAPYLLTRLLPALEKNFPSLELTLNEMQTSQIVSALERDELDVGVLATPLGQVQIGEIPLFYEPFFVLAHKKHELAQLKRVKASALKYKDIWLLNEGHCLRTQVLDVCSLRRDQLLKRNYQFESGSLETLKSLVDAYGGYTLVPQLASQGVGEHCTLIGFERPQPAREIGLVVRRRQLKSKLVESLAEAILASLPPAIRSFKKRDFDVLSVD